MGEIRAVLVWMGGVLTETIPDAVARLVYTRPIEEIEFETRYQIKRLANELSLGRLTGDLFFLEVRKASGIKMDSKDMSAAITSTISVRAPVLDVIKELGDSCAVWIISEYPVEWHKPIVERCGLASSVPDDRIILTATSQLERMVPEIFFYAARQTRAEMDACLLIDGKSSRAVDAVRYGLASAIYLEPRRLRREFVLRRMLPAPEGFVYPTLRRYSDPIS